MTKIFLAASMNFYPKLLQIESDLKSRGFEVEIPISAKMMRDNNDYVVEHFKGNHTNAQKADFFRENIDNMEKCDSILVINEEKNGTAGYIGPSVIMEIGIAWYLRKKIYVLNEFSRGAAYKPEIEAFGAQIINTDLSKIKD